MIRRLVASDKVAVTGCIVGLCSLFLTWFTLKPNRLASGAGIALLDIPSWYFAAIIIIAWLFCLVFSLVDNKRRNVILLGLGLNFIVIMVSLMAGSSSAGLLVNQPEIARVSPGPGLWTALIGTYIAIYSCRQRLQVSPIWQNIISWSGLFGLVIVIASGWMNTLSIMVEFNAQKAQFVQQLGNHCIIFAGSVVIGIIIGVPLGTWAHRNNIVEKPIFYIAGTLQTIPSLALFGLLIAPLAALTLAHPFLRDWGIGGIGSTPAIIAIVLYSLLPIARNTYTGLHQIEPAVINSGSGMGMTRFQVLRKIEIPLAAPLVLEGIRTASIQAVGNTAIAAIIGAGGLGLFIFQGISQAADDVVLLGVIPIMLLTVMVDVIMRLIIKLATPRGLKTP
jgi:osmoprotectant transport system permease protein